MRVRDVIFDLDGTLADSLGLCYASFIDVFQRHTGRTYTPLEVRAMFGPSEEGVLQRVLPERWESAMEEWLEFYEREHARYATCFPGIRELLEWLKGGGARVGVVTGKGPRSAEITLRELDLARYVDVLKPGSPNGGIKPVAIREVLSEWGALPVEAAYVGDVAADMRAAVEVGTVPLGAAWAAGANADSLWAAGAIRVFSAPGELQRWLARESSDPHPDPLPSREREQA